MLALFDLDGFKHYNDTFGHPAGDVLLARLGGNLQAFLDGRGRAFRMGGDEFCALFEPRGEDAARHRSRAPRWRSPSTATASGSAAPTARSRSRRRRPSPTRPCASPTSACTPRRTPGACRPRASPRTPAHRAAGARPRPDRPDRAPSPTWPRPPPAGSAWTATSARRSATPPSCATSASRSPRSSPRAADERGLRPPPPSPASASSPPHPPWPRPPPSCARATSTGTAAAPGGPRRRSDPARRADRRRLGHLRRRGRRRAPRRRRHPLRPGGGRGAARDGQGPHASARRLTASGSPRRGQGHSALRAARSAPAHASVDFVNHWLTKSTLAPNGQTSPHAATPALDATAALCSPCPTTRR